MSFACVYLDDRDTCSDIVGTQIVIFKEDKFEFSIEDADSEISIYELMTELIKVKELLPIHIQKIIEPYSNVTD